MRRGCAGAAVVAVLVALDSPLIAQPAQLECFGAPATIVGTAGDDLLNGTPGADVIVGLGGNDQLNGLAGDDRLCGEGGGFDLLAGGPGDDLLDGGEQAPGSPLDVSEGDLVSHLSSATAVNVDLAAGRSTGEGTDTLLGFEGVAGSQLDDTLSGDDAPNSFFPLAGNDVISGAGGTDSANFGLSPRGVRVDLGRGTASGEGADRLVDVESVGGTNFDDVIVGDAGENTLSGGGGNDQISAGPGNDGVIGGAGDDQVAAGPGQDIVTFLFAAAGVTLDLAAGTARGDGSDTITGVEHVIGTRLADRISGDGEANSITPLSGDDVVHGRGGLDDVTFSFSERGVRASLASGTATGEGSDRIQGVEHLAGSIHDDVLAGNAGANALFGSSGADTIGGGASSDLLVGDFPDDELAGRDRLSGQSGDDFFMGGGNDDEFSGGPGSADEVTYAFAPRGVTASIAAGRGEGDGIDRMREVEGLRGSPFADTLTGDAGANRISGDAGDDRLDGGADDDFLRGGTGVDSLDAASGRDYCLDDGGGRGCEIRALPSESPGRTLAGLETSVDVGGPSCGGAPARVLSRLDAALRPPPPKGRYTTSIVPPRRVRPSRPNPLLALVKGPVRGAASSFSLIGELRRRDRRPVAGPAGRLAQLVRDDALQRSVRIWSPARAARTRQTGSPDVQIVTWRPVLHRYVPRSRRWVVHRRFPAATAAVDASGVASWADRTGRPLASVALRVGRGRFAWSAEVRSGADRVVDWAEPHVRRATGGGLFQPWCDFGG